VSLSTQPTPCTNKPNPEQQGKSTGLYSNSQEAIKTLKEDFSYWTGKLTESSFAVSLAVVGANWAVFRSVDEVFKRSYAIWSIAVVGLSLVVSLIASFCLGESVRGRIAYAEKDLARWEKEFRANIGEAKPWPLTKWIERSALGLRWAKMLLPIVGVGLFLLALHETPPKKESEIPSRQYAIGKPATPSPVPQVTAHPSTPVPTPTATATETPTATPAPQLRPTTPPHRRLHRKGASNR